VMMASLSPSDEWAGDGDVIDILTFVLIFTRRPMGSGLAIIHFSLSFSSLLCLLSHSEDGDDRRSLSGYIRETGMLL